MTDNGVCAEIMKGGRWRPAYYRSADFFEPERIGQGLKVFNDGQFRMMLNGIEHRRHLTEAEAAVFIAVDHELAA